MNSAPLEYLLLDSQERINYRVERGITIKEWYESFRPERPTVELMRYDEAIAYLGISSTHFYRLLDRGRFGTPIKECSKKDGERKSKRRLLSSDILQEIMSEEVRLVPVSSFHDLLRSQELYLSRDRFDDIFSCFYKNGLDGHRPVVSIRDAAKIIYDLRRRREVIERWPTLDDLRRESGLSLSPGRLKNYFRFLIERGELKVVTVRDYTHLGRRRGSGRLYKIEPNHYREVVEREKEKLRFRASGVTSSAIAQKLGVSQDAVSQRLQVAVKLGVINAELMHDHLSPDGRFCYIVPVNHADSFIEGRISLPSVKAYRRQRAVADLRAKVINGRAPPLNGNDISPAVERELWQRARAGQQDAFQVLLAVYDGIIREEAARFQYGVREEDRRRYLPTALFEFVHRLKAHRYTTRDHVISFLREKLVEQARQERPSWMSANRPVGVGRLGLVDLVDEGEGW